jgi:hypothetical protein
MASFGGAIFRQKAYALPLDVTAEVSVEHIPGGNTSYIDIGGVNVDRLSIAVHLTSDAQRIALAAKVGTQGSLVYEDGTVTAVLVSMRRSRRYPNDHQFADLEFVIVG